MCMNQIESLSDKMGVVELPFEVREKKLCDKAVIN